MQYGTILLSKVIDANDPSALTRYGITERDFPTQSERAVFRFVRDYAEQNRGEAPSYATVAVEVPDFAEWYSPQVGEPYEYLTEQVKGFSAKKQIVELINGTEKEIEKGIPSKFAKALEGNSNGNEALKLLQDEIEQVIMNTNTRSKIGRTLADIKESMRDEYIKREQGKSSKRWDTPFKSLTEEIGGWYSGDIYGIMGESGRGKSYLIACAIDSLLRQGATVLWKSYEVKEYVSIARLVSIATAVDEMFADELGRKVGIPNKQILSGKLEDVVRDQFFDVVEALDSYYPGTLYFQGKSGPELTRTLDDLERELMRIKVDAVVLDPFYGLTDVYGKNVNKTAGGAAEYAATRFENIVGDNDVVGFYTVQATVEKKQRDEAGVREIKLPTRDQVKTSKRLLDIATNLVGFDSVEKEGIAMLGIEKGRNGGEDFQLELTALFNYGVLREMPKGEDAATHFNF